MNTKFSYMYRDAANYKKFFECIFPGEITSEQVKSIIDACDGENFIPRSVGLPGGMFIGEAGYDDRYDHYWCEHDFEDSFELTNEAPTHFITIERLVAAFEGCKGRWEEAIYYGSLPKAGIAPDVSETAGKLKVYGLSVVDSAGFANGRDSSVEVFTTPSACVDAAYQSYKEQWEALQVLGAIGVRDGVEVDSNGKRFLSKKEFQAELENSGYVVVCSYDDRVQIEFFEKEIDISKEMLVGNEKDSSVLSSLNEKIAHAEGKVENGPENAFEEKGPVL